MIYHPTDDKWIEEELAEMREAGDLDPENPYFRQEIERRIGWERFRAYVQSVRDEWPLRYED